MTAPISMVHTMDATSINTASHFIQVFNAKSFRHFDHGTHGNEIAYGSPTPPAYEVGRIRVPNLLVRGVGDLASTMKVVTSPIMYKMMVVRLRIFVGHRNFVQPSFGRSQDLSDSGA